MKAALTVSMVMCLGACMADPGWDRRVSAIEATLTSAESSGAMRCAPRELALGRAHLGFAVFERERGHHTRAYEHLAQAEPNADAAAFLSPAPRCSGASEPAGPADPILDTQVGVAPRVDVVETPAVEEPPPRSGPEREPTEVVAQEPGGPGHLGDRPPTEPAPPPSVLDQDLDGVPDHQDECPTVGGEGGAGCPGAYGGLVMRDDRLVLLRPVVLDPDGEPDERTRALLRSVVQALLDRPRMIVEIGAHTHAEGSELGNLAESQRRAERVRDLLVAAGAPAVRVRARGYGEELPIESNGTEEGRAANQRIELRRVEAGSGGL